MTNDLPKPMANKTPEMQDAIEELFPGTKQAIEEHKCPSCRELIKGFRDSLSKKEYGISGLCQNCQDKAFGA